MDDLFRVSGFPWGSRLELQNFFLQLVLQMPPSRFLDGAALGRNGLLLGLAFLPGSGFHGAGQMRNPRALAADFFLLRVGVGLHAAMTQVETFLAVNFDALPVSKFLDGPGFVSLGCEG